MSLQHDLAKFLEERINAPENEGKVFLDEDTELLTSGLISSIALLDLSAWIEEHMATPIDLTTIQPAKEWNTMKGILSFIKRHSTDQNE